VNWIMNLQIRIPAGAKDHLETQTVPVDEGITIHTLMPHMHLLGKSMKAVVELPDGKVKPLIWVDDWDFNWQLQYALKEPMHVPAGSTIRVEAIYDNSADNPRNPNNPPKRVKFGEQTDHEMFLMVMGYTVDGEKLRQGR
ncbi:MAG: hypothetical protein QOJ65_724, partial [Fimbriimonadaceae bacterium]|nr:hypothetical protein [Fimbriimonadaceae bacterium]